VHVSRGEEALAGKSRSSFRVVWDVEIDFRAAWFVGMKDAEWRRINVKSDEILTAHIRVPELVNIRNI
jgi:hypothetical protein